MYLTFCFRLGWAGVASLMVRLLGVSCYSGQWIFGLSLFLGLALGFSFVRVSLWGSGGAAWLLDFVFGVALGYGSRGMGKLGLFVGGCSFWGLGASTGALVISDYKWVVVLVFGNDWGFRSRILGTEAPLGTLFFLSLGIFSSRPFWGQDLGGLAVLVGALGWYPSSWSLMRGRGTAAIWGFPARNF